MFYTDEIALKENVNQKVERRNNQAKIMLEIIELAKKLDISCSDLAHELRYPEHIDERTIEKLRQSMDRSFWYECLDELQVEKFLTTSDKDKLFSSLEEKCPVFNEDNVNSTLIGFMASKDATATEMIKKIYHQVTDIVFRKGNTYKNDSEKRIQTGVPMIFRASIFYTYGKGLPTYVSCNRYNNFSLLDDLERALYLCDGKTQPDRQNNIRSKTDLALRERLTQVDGEYFHLELFKNGNVKVTFKDSNLLKTFNYWGQTGKYLGK